MVHHATDDPYKEPLWLSINGVRYTSILTPDLWQNCPGLPDKRRGQENMAKWSDQECTAPLSRSDIKARLIVLLHAYINVNSSKVVMWMYKVLRVP